MSQLSTPVPSPMDFPESDGAPMGETGDHIEAIIDLLAQLRLRYSARHDVYVGSNQFLYWEPSDPRQVTCPDLYLVLGRPGRPFRDTWKTWEEDGRVPDLVVEVSSRSTRLTDLRSKRALYAGLGVREYVLFDPRREYLKPPLQGLRLEGDRYAPIPESPAGVHLETVGLWLRAEGRRVQAWSEAGERLPAPWQEYPDLVGRLEGVRAERDAAAARAELEASRALAATARAEAEASRAQAATARADAATARADAAAARAQAATARAEAEAEARAESERAVQSLEATVSELLAKLARSNAP